MNNFGNPMDSSSVSDSRSSSRRSSSRRKRQQSSCLFLLLGAFISFICVSVTGFALYRGGYVPFGLSSSLTATAIARNNASCQALIDMAIQASGSFCENTSSNKVCYGNISIKSDLVPGAAQSFSERGDIIRVNELLRLSASPLDLDSNEWGIAVFKLIANLPRSLPGETVTMVVFGNATLDNESGESENLESFYFSSDLGQISCEKVPFDGLMVSSPDGSGIRFMINESELTLMGDAGIKAVNNGEMEVSIYEGSGRIVSNGKEQYFGAGQKVSVQLGGEKGNRSISDPSEPKPLTQEELDMACTMTGEFCTQSEITPISEDQARSLIQGQITSTPSLTPTQTLTLIPSITFAPTNTLLVLPTSTTSPGPTQIPTFTRTPGPTNTNSPTRTPTRTNTPTSTFTSTSTLTPTLTPTNTPTPTVTPVEPSEPLCPSTIRLINPTNDNAGSLGWDIENTSGADITINRFFAYWVKSPPSQKLDRLSLNGNLIWNTSDVDSPSDFPAEASGGSWPSTNIVRTIPNGATLNFVIQFSQNPQPSSMHLVFTTTPAPCRVIGSW